MKSSRWMFAALLLLALSVRSVGLFRGLEDGSSFHPDTAKQVQATHNYLRGHYLWYTGSLAYDGYPYALNHVDEWLIRATYPAVRAVLHGLQPSLDLPAIPTVGTLYYICRALRVLYSLLAWGLFGWTLARLRVPPLQRQAWLLLGALAPILSTVTHSASGDVGPDLFVMLALAAFAHARDGAPRGRLFFAGGFALGLAFACKYHGVLGGLTPGLFLLFAPIAWRERFRLGGLTAAGALAGFALLTPHVFIDFDRTVENIGLNFSYIQKFGVDPSFFEQPLHRRLWISLSGNILVAIHAMGLGALALGLGGAGLALWRLRAARGREQVWDAALIAMPFAVLVLALAGKPELQPFHFSFLLLPLLLGAALLWRATSAPLRYVLPVLLLGAAVEYALQQRNEWTFWGREDTRNLAIRMQEELLDSDPAARRADVLATLVVEPANLAVFRNKPAAVRLADARDWTAYPDDALPATPWPLGNDWIFADLPAFPRESRMVTLTPGEWISRGIITRAAREALPITFYAGSRDAEVRLRIDGVTHDITLPPGSQTSLLIRAESGAPFVRDGTEARRHWLSVRARGAPVLLRVGEAPSVAPDPERRDRKLARALFLDGVRRPTEGRVPLKRQTGLMPGRYALEVDAPREAPAMTLHVDDSLLNHPARAQQIPLEWRDGRWSAEWTHPSDFLFTGLSLELARAAEAPLPWRIRPLEALPFEPATNAPPKWAPQVAFGGERWIFGNIETPTQLIRGVPLVVRMQLDTMPGAREILADYSAFVHVLDANRKQVFARDIRLISIPSRRGGPQPAQDLGPLDLPPGEYQLLLGLYHMRTNIRVEPDQEHGRDRRVSLGILTVTEAP